ncbi:MAG: GTP cyclohydrolase II [Candidatus Poseidoniia archaeon]|jgi:GTP cyclohydrolase II|nr:GTP cyclohydrolase II [Candidatus Poseidoniia archaeon]MDP6846278.1 GTP cyclohydrolase II [Candidatus Poseidoniia archaeon]MDP7007025.1 GTP cyclohydrolase II [Candidatus Poseidoniia archaeon]|tara:strand:+ start:6371 stop:6961 length:591 start_codon:yes stop_codon:yes gene_type:complete
MAEPCEDDALAAARLPTRFGEFRILTFPGETTNREHIALALGDMAGEVVVRIHSECLTGDVFHSDRCDCGEQLDLAMERIAEAGSGVIIYLRQEGRGIGLVNKLHAYNLQDEGLDTVEANEVLGFSGEMRQYGDGVTILKCLGVSCVALLTNNPAKVEALREAGLTVRREPHTVAPKAENRSYLRTKAGKMGHLLD